MIPLLLTIEDPDDRDFMEFLYTEYNRLMYSQIKIFLKNSWDIEDVLQTVLLRLINKIPKLREFNRNQRVNYIIVTCRNASLNFIRDSKRKTEFSYDEEFDSSDDSYLSADERLEWIEWREDMANAWKALDDRSKRILEMKYILEKTDAEIAQDIGVAPNSVRMLLTRARNNLKKSMKEQD